MSLSYQLFIAIRYLKSRKKNRGISFNTIISISGVALGVMALLVVMSVMSGFHEDLQKKILGANAHAVVLNHNGVIEDYKPLMAKLEKEKLVTSMSPFVLGQVMVSSGKRAHGVFLRGIESSSEFKTTDILKHIKYGSIENLPPADALSNKDGGTRSLPWIIIGNELSAMLGAMTGDRINVISPVGETGPMGMLPKVRQFRVAAIFAFV